MTKGLVRANNLADLSSKQDSIVNLELAIADYDSLKSLYTTAGLDFSVIGGIAGSTGNYQAQVDGISSTLSGIVLSGFVNRQGNGLISTSWTNSDGIISTSGVLSGYSPSSGTTFALSIEQGEAVITTSGLSANDLAYNSFRQANSTVVRASPPSGFNTLQLIPLQVGGQSFFVQASETPSFHIAPARMRHALDLVTGNLLGTYNSASPAMAVGPDGILYQPAANAPVIEYDPVTLACLGARIWGVVTNLSLRSEEFNSTYWGKELSTITANALTSPANTTTADFLVENTSSGIHRVNNYSIASVTSGTTYTFSVFAKSSNRNLYINADAAINARATFNLASGTAVTGSGASSITAMPNGWFRCSVTGTATATKTDGLFLQINNNFLAADHSYLGDGVSGIYLWGAQFNTGPLGPYVPTTTTAASSTADVWSITGADFSRIWNQASVTLYAEAVRDVVPASDFSVLITARAAALTERAEISYLVESLAGYGVVTGGVTQAEMYPSVSARTRRVAGAFAANDFAVSANGSAVLTDTSGAMPVVDRLFIGSTGTGQYLNGYIRELAIFRSRRPNTNLQAMTQ